MSKYHDGLASVSIPSPFTLTPGCSLECRPFEYPQSDLDWADNVINYNTALDTLWLYFKHTLPDSIQCLEKVTEGLNVFVAKDEDENMLHGISEHRQQPPPSHI
eukprot:Phypoly_transcript_20029.p2 GENE.Phypoly_transcript_20029~~Phypoly_transcript_20029.p2  ORF type:complete len:104 (+),score=12.55 Phypoly_transcript_20029:143-454(+)